MTLILFLYVYRIIFVQKMNVVFIQNKTSNQQSHDKRSQATTESEPEARRQKLFGCCCCVGFFLHANSLNLSNSHITVWKCLHIFFHFIGKKKTKQVKKRHFTSLTVKSLKGSKEYIVVQTFFLTTNTQTSPDGCSWRPGCLPVRFTRGTTTQSRILCAGERPSVEKKNKKRLFLR